MTQQLMSLCYSYHCYIKSLRQKTLHQERILMLMFITKHFIQGLSQDFLASHDLVFCTTLDGSKVDYTWNFDVQRFPTIGHFIINTNLDALQDVSVSVQHSVHNFSDHDPIAVMPNLDVDTLLATPVFHSSKPAWHKANDLQPNKYWSRLSCMLHSIGIPVSALVCGNHLCNNARHFRDLNE
jgi:hypothetical protein